MPPEEIRVIEFSNISFKYAEEWVISNLNMKIQIGEIVGLKGPSGCGKVGSSGIPG